MNIKFKKKTHKKHTQWLNGLKQYLKSHFSYKAGLILSLTLSLSLSVCVCVCVCFFLSNVSELEEMS